MLPRALAVPAKVYLDITAKCNLRCKYCYHFDSAAAVSQDLETQEWIQFINEMSAVGVFHVNISGGEALYRPDILEILSAFKQTRMRFDLVTNGFLLTPEIAKFLAESKRCNVVQVSLDGPEAVHDSARGKGSWQGAVNAIRLLKEYKLPIAVRATLGKHNLGYLMETADLILGELQVPAFTTNCVAIEGLCHKEATELELSLEDMMSSIEEHRQVLEKYPKRLLSSTGPWGLYLKWQKLYSAFQNEQYRGKYAGCLGGCAAVYKQMGVRADGVMVPCVQLPQYEMGRINQDSLVEVWQNSPVINRVRERRDISLSSFPECQGCKYLPYCFGGCPATGAMDLQEINRRVCRFCFKDVETYFK